MLNVLTAFLLFGFFMFSPDRTSSYRSPLSTGLDASMALRFSVIGSDAAVQKVPRVVVSYLAYLAFKLVLQISPSLFPFSSFVFSIN